MALVDAQGSMLESRFFGRLPEAGKAGLKSRLKAEAFHRLDRNPALKLAAVADGAKDNRAFLDSLCPDVTLVDFWQHAQHVKVAADAAFGPDTAAGKAWSGKWRHVLRHDPRGVGKVIDAMRHLLRKGQGAGDVRRELAFFRGNRRRMNYADAAEAGYAIGSGAVESAKKVLVTSRMKRSGQSWGRDGGWKPPQCANDKMRQRQPAGGAGRARRAIRENNIMEPES